MDLDSVLIFKAPSPKSSVGAICSPGNNPFDDLLRKTIECTTIIESNNRRSSVKLAENLRDVGRKSLPFPEMETSDFDFGRESLGILPPDFEKDCLGFTTMNNCEMGRESLGILEITSLRESLGFQRDSIGILNLTGFGRESLNCGRESLGILHVKSPDIRFGEEDMKIPDIILSTIDENSDHVGNPLDIAFIESLSRKSSAASSTSSSVNPSFNSYSLEGPSTIYPSSIRKFQNATKSEYFNKDEITEISASLYSYPSVYSPLNKGRIFSPRELFSVRSRIQSLPVTSEENFQSAAETADLFVTERKCWSASSMKSKTLERSFCGKLDFDDNSIEFHDSVFIEGHHIAEKIADGSILNNSSGNEIGILDATPQPNWPHDLSYEKELCTNGDTEAVFKTVDKKILPSMQDNFKIKICKSDSTSSNENNDNNNTNNNSKSSQSNENDSKQNISNITCGSEKYSANNKSQWSKDPKEILQNLSEILSCTHRSDQQKSEGQILLSSLADMLSENKSNTRGSPNDSGHSSIDHYSPKEDKHECFEVLDLRMRNVGEVLSNGEPNANIVLDVPSPSQTKSNKEKRLSQSFSSRTVLPVKVTQKKNMSALGLDVKKDISRAASVNSSASSVNSNDSKTVNSASRLSVAGKLRQKTVSQNAKKGPMKAVIPVGDMKKRYSLAVTPEKSKISSAMQSKRTSTPISGPKLKPMAASTPAGRPVKHQKEIAHSPLGKPDARCSFGRDQPSTPPSSLPKSLNTESKFLRRNSVSEIKKSEGIGKLKRSNSVEKESGIMSSLAKVRQNIINSPYYHSKRNSLRESNSNEAENRTKGIPVAKSVSLVPKLRTLGKENRGK